MLERLDPLKKETWPSPTKISAHIWEPATLEANMPHYFKKERTSRSPRSFPFTLGSALRINEGSDCQLKIAYQRKAGQRSLSEAG